MKPLDFDVSFTQSVIETINLPKKLFSFVVSLVELMAQQCSSFISFTDFIRPSIILSRVVIEVVPAHSSVVGIVILRKSRREMHPFLGLGAALDPLPQL